MTVQMPAFNPLAPQMCVDPYPAYAALRQGDPVHHSALGMWIITRHADVAAFFKDQRLQHQYVTSQSIRLGPGVVDEPYFALFRRMVFILDNPDHRRIRQLFTGIFHPNRITGLRAD